MRKKYLIIGVVAVLITLGIILYSYIQKPIPPEKLEEQINELQLKINKILETYPWLSETDVCKFKDVGKQIILDCKTSGGFSSASGAYMEKYSEEGVLECVLVEKTKYNCTFQPYPKIEPINKPKYLTIVREGPDYYFPQCKSGITNYDEVVTPYTIMHVKDAKKLFFDITEERCERYKTTEVKNLCLSCLKEYKTKKKWFSFLKR